MLFVLNNVTSSQVSRGASGIARVYVLMVAAMVSLSLPSMYIIRRSQEGHLGLGVNCGCR